MSYYVGIDLGGTNIAVGVVNEDYRIVGRANEKTKAFHPAEEIADDMAATARRAVENAGVTFDELVSRPVTRVVLRAPGMPVDRFSQIVADSGLHSVEYAIGWTAWLDVAPEGVTKASALEALISRLGVDSARTLAVGDGSNDVEMIEWAGAGVVMGSAPQWVRDRGDILTEPVWRDGCAAVLDALIERVRHP